jgi:hypothetical protein
MLTIEIPEPLQDKIRIMARQAEQTPEQLALRINGVSAAWQGRVF